jgi:plastocyanin
VAINNFAFSPATLQVKLGQQVTWTNQQPGVTHTVTADSGTFDHPMPSGATFSFHLRHGGQLRLPLQDPPVDARDDRGVIAT